MPFNAKTVFVKPLRALFNVGKLGDIVEIRESEMRKFSPDVWELATKEELAKYKKLGGKVKRIGIGSKVDCSKGECNLDPKAKEKAEADANAKAEAAKKAEEEEAAKKAEEEEAAKKAEEEEAAKNKK